MMDTYYGKQDKSDKSSVNLGEQALRHLYLESPKAKEDASRNKSQSLRQKNSGDSPLFRWATPLESSKPGYSSQSNDPTPPLKLLNKFANKGFLDKSIREIDDDIRRYTKSPLVIDAALGALAGGGYYLFDRFVNPPHSRKFIQEAANLAAKDGYTMPESYYVGRALEKDKKRRLLYSAAVGLGAAGVTGLIQYNPAYLDSWRRFVPKEGKQYVMKKSASMFGPASAMSANAIRGAVMANPNLSAGTKAEIVDMLHYAPSGMLTSTDLVGTAVRTGASARAGKPLGRLATAAVADAATAYALGNVLGVGSPGRLAAVTGVTSGLARGLFSY